MTEAEELASRGRHRADTQGPVVPRWVIGQLVAMAAFLVLAPLLMVHLGDQDELVKYGAEVAQAVVLLVAAAVAELWGARSTKRRTHVSEHAVRQVQPRSDAELPVAQRSDWTLPSRTFYVDAAARDRLARARRSGA